MANIELVIKISEEKFSAIRNHMYCGVYDLDLYKAIENGLPLSELKDKWKSSYEQMYQEKICELNKRKKELENQLNISVQNIIENEMIMCCEEE